MLFRSSNTAAMGEDAERRVFDAIRPEKDVDGLHPLNVGRLVQNRASLVSCTPAGVIDGVARGIASLRTRRVLALVRGDPLTRNCWQCVAPRRREGRAFAHDEHRLARSNIFPAGSTAPRFSD